MMILEMLVKSMPDGRVCDVGTGVPTWLDMVGGGEEELNNQLE